LFSFFIISMSDINYVTDSSKEDSSVSTFYRQDDSSLTDSSSDGSSMDTDASDAYVCEGMDEPNYISADHCYYPDISRWKVRWHEYPELDDEEREPEDDSDDSDESVVDAKPVKVDTSPGHEKPEKPSYRRPWMVAEHQRCLAALKRLEEHPLPDLYDSDDSIFDVNPLKTEK
jgi:hypothetical protein